MVPRVMDEYDCAALLDESCIKIWLCGERSNNV
jgi:hypothetical protein